MKPPRHLSREMKALWVRLTTESDFSPEHIKILAVACEQYDLSQSARLAIARDRLISGGKRNPLISVQQKAMELFLRGIRDLGIEGPE